MEWLLFFFACLFVCLFFQNKWEQGKGGEIHLVVMDAIQDTKLTFVIHVCKLQRLDNVCFCSWPEDCIFFIQFYGCTLTNHINFNLHSMLNIEKLYIRISLGENLGVKVIRVREVKPVISAVQHMSYIPCITTNNNTIKLSSLDVN